MVKSETYGNIGSIQLYDLSFYILDLRDHRRFFYWNNKCIKIIKTFKDSPQLENVSYDGEN